MKNINDLGNGWAFIIAVILFTILACLFGGCDYNYAPKGNFTIIKIHENK